MVLNVLGLSISNDNVNIITIFSVRCGMLLLMIKVYPYNLMINVFVFVLLSRLIYFINVLCVFPNCYNFSNVLVHVGICVAYELQQFRSAGSQ